VICAMACAPSMKEAQTIYNSHGFMTFPQFIDNNFVEKGKADIKFLDKWLRRYSCGRIQYAIAPDFMLEEAIKLKDEYPDINWIWPLHSIHENITEFDWIGYPHDPPRRDYNLRTFHKLTINKKKWYLGFHEGESPSALLDFDGFDTTLPTFYAMKFKLWKSWNKSEEAGDLKLNYYEIMAYNVISFKAEIRKIFNNRENRKMTDFMNDELVKPILPIGMEKR
jgi:hypothetical protein